MGKKTYEVENILSESVRVAEADDLPLITVLSHILEEKEIDYDDFAENMPTWFKPRIEREAIKAATVDGQLPKELF